MNYLLMVCIITIVMTAFRTIRRGTRGIIYGAVTWAIVVFVVSQGVGPVSNYLHKNPKVSAPIEEKVSPYIELIGQIDAIAAGTDLTSGEVPSAEELARQYFQGFAGSEEQLDAYENYVLYGIPMDDTGVDPDLGDAFDAQALENALSQADGSASALTNPTDQYVQLKEYIMGFVFEILAMFICYLMAKAVLLIARVVIYHNKENNERPLLPCLAWGIVEGVLYMDVYLMIITRLEFFNFGKLAMGWITQDKILSFLFEHNVIEFFI